MQPREPLLVAAGREALDEDDELRLLVPHEGRAAAHVAATSTIYLTCEGSFSAVSTATVARKDAFCSIFRDL